MALYRHLTYPGTLDMAYSSVILMKITRCDMLDNVHLNLLGDRVSLNLRETPSVTAAFCA